MSPRPPNLLIPIEIKIQEYLTQPGYGSPHVSRVIDYIITKEAYILVMEYSGKEWVTLDGYIKAYGKFSVDKARLIIKEVVEALVSLRKLGILHGDVLDRNILYNDKTGGVKLIDFGVSKPLEGWNQDNSVQAKFSNSESKSSRGKLDVGRTEVKDMESIGNLLYFLLTLRRPYHDPRLSQEEVAKELRNRLDNPESQLTINAADLIASLCKHSSSQMVSIEDIPDHPFFTSQ
ncbi:hypothetical protein BASA50_010580 [Batrachochytrium salamandrivorans]|uniref:non-specific serine/threonine protein kinase n=1 Tax=Batrachochytrium salamandrivorans TaxID=1357716 RepID=A0ABQ8EY14_9FUNG|nr:hypothetical protein BASA50_010580 [Batrachochytrium salamandrivorans]